MKQEITRYSKQAVVKSSAYRENRDLVQTVLEENKEYTLNQVDTLINQFKKGKVKSC